MEGAAWRFTTRPWLAALLLELRPGGQEPNAAPHRAADQSPASGPGNELLFTGSSSIGELREALDDAVERARAAVAEHGTTLDFRWRLTGVRGRWTAEPRDRSLSVTVRVMGGAPAALQKKAGPGGSADGGGF